MDRSLQLLANNSAMQTSEQLILNQCMLPLALPVYDINMSVDLLVHGKEYVSGYASSCYLQRHVQDNMTIWFSHFLTAEYFGPVPEPQCHRLLESRSRGRIYNFSTFVRKCCF